MSIEIAIFLAIASGFAGFVDAMAGGGGLIQLPALLVGLPNKELPLILGTNKVPSIFGTAAAARNYFKNIKPDIPLTLTMMVPAFAGSMGGAALAVFVPKDFFKPFIVFLLILVAIYTWRKPELGMAENLKFTHKKRLVIVGLIGLMIGFYDGIFGPGTGTFLVFFLVSTIGYAFLKASATAKLVNIATNAGCDLKFSINWSYLVAIRFTSSFCQCDGCDYWLTPCNQRWLTIGSKSIFSSHIFTNYPRCLGYFYKLNLPTQLNIEEGKKWERKKR